jgi:hypothetical protein
MSRSVPTNKPPTSRSVPSIKPSTSHSVPTNKPDLVQCADEEVLDVT